MRPSSTMHYVSAGLSPPKGSSNRTGYSSARKTNNLRPSSSLQDFAHYRRLDPEDVDHNVAIDFIHDKVTHPFLRDTSSPKFTKDKVPPASPFLQKKWTKILMNILCLVCIALSVFMLGKFLYILWSGGPSKYFVVLDCGSTGTRVYIYEASIADKKSGNLPIVLRSYSAGYRKPMGQSGRAYNRMETEPGLDKLVRNSTGLKAAIKPLLQWAEKQIPQGSHKTTSVFLYATAGVRRLPKPDSDWILDHAWSVLKRSPFLCRREWVKIISGMEEAYFGWIALNHETGILGAIPKKATFGALDLGGSSLQVTFENKEPVGNETSLNLSIGAVNHHLSAYSLSGYGLNDAFDKSVVTLLKGMPKVSKVDLAQGNVEIKHPCLHAGYKSQYTCSHCASVDQETGSPHYRDKTLGKGSKPGVPVWLTGAPNWAECTSLAKVAINLSEWSSQSPGIDCDTQPCALSNDLPHPRGQFYAMSGFFVVYRFFNLTSEATLDDVLEKGRQFCDKTWDVAYNSVPPQPFIEQYCFRAPYIVRLLREGLHITDSQIIIGSGGTTWTQGVALVEAGNVFATSAELHSFELFQVKIDPVVFFAILLISSFLLVCALSCIGNWGPRFFHGKHLPLSRRSSAPSTLLKRWSPITSGDGRAKLPPSLMSVGESKIELVDPPPYLSGMASGVMHSFSSGNLPQLHPDSNGLGYAWNPRRVQTRLQSRRSQSREDLISSLEAHTVKV